jgi:hypothetical protein
VAIFKTVFIIVIETCVCSFFMTQMRGYQLPVSAARCGSIDPKYILQLLLVENPKIAKN